MLTPSVPKIQRTMLIDYLLDSKKLINQINNI